MYVVALLSVVASSIIIGSYLHPVQRTPKMCSKWMYCIILFWWLIELRRLNWAWHVSNLLFCVRLHCTHQYPNLWFGNCVEKYRAVSPSSIWVNIRIFVSKILCGPRTNRRCSEFTETNFKRNFVFHKKGATNERFCSSSKTSNRVYPLSLLYSHRNSLVKNSSHWLVSTAAFQQTLHTHWKRKALGW